MGTRLKRTIAALSFFIALTPNAVGDDDAQTERLRGMGGINFIQGMAQGESDTGPPGAAEWEQALARFGCGYTKTGGPVTSVTVFCDESRVMGRILYYQAVGVLDYKTPAEVFEHLPQWTVARLVQLSAGIALIKLEGIGQTIDLRGEIETVDETYASFRQPVFSGRLDVNIFSNFARGGDIKGALILSGALFDGDFMTTLKAEEDAFQDWLDQKIASVEKKK